MAGFVSNVRTEISARMAPALPAALRRRLVPAEYSWSYADLRPVARAKPGNTRLLIARANFASQGYYWARAAETLPGVSAVNLAFGWAPEIAHIKPDVAVKGNVGRHSHLWARKQRKAILRGFTHVLYEAERPLLPTLYDGDLVAEINDLQDHGIAIAMVSHGSDTRVPSRHVELEPYSPFVDPLGGLTANLETSTRLNHQALDALGLPTYVSTPDLLLYRPEATWLPTLTDPQRWERLPASAFGTRTPVVLHVPSRSALKGTAAISPAMRRLEHLGLIHYVEAERVPYEDMPTMIARADIVIDQLSMALYGVASVEAMLAGRIVVAQAGQHIRTHIARETGWDLPIVEANPATISDVVEDIATHPGHYRDRIEQGRRFAREVHSDAAAAAALEPFLLG
ncbi:glycosyltransferase family protein [Microbacterium gallinarum]|uniref:Glycosyltransferase family 1 protein n=1 Tax=Microbacterium gallinarum TaxID=2762209 RepID=A0ABR8WZD6_9MICO|nr:hypothetical protein [Microbacterium gallinarum]MBD8022242.1 hypothetical protein [Microbacterium gallinarum]